MHQAHIDEQPLYLNESKSFNILPKEKNHFNPKNSSIKNFFPEFVRITGPLVFYFLLLTNIFGGDKVEAGRKNRS
jgi:hypothetical protein